MTKLCQCPNCACKFKSIGNLSKHRAKNHSNSMKAQIRNGIKNSPNNPTNRIEKQQKAIKESLEFLGTVSGAIITKNPALALQAVKEGVDVLKAVQELRK